MVRCMDRKNRQMVRSKDNTYENNIDGWMDGKKIYEKIYGLLDGWMDGQNKAHEKFDGQKNI